jgi:RND family efflux transporter MFP subunit
MLKKILLPIIILVGSIGATVALVANREQPIQEEITEARLLVDVIQPQLQDTYITVSSQGTVEPRTRTNIVSEVSGRVTEVSLAFVAGGFFRNGDVLLKLDDQNYRAAVSQNAAAVATARSLLEQERGQADVAQREWDRMSEQQREQIRARDLYLRKPQLEEAEARLASAQADLEKAQADLAKTIITAPYDGLVSAKNTDIGQFVSTGSAIAEIFAVDYAEVRLPIPENKIQYLDLPSSIQDFNGADTAYNSGSEVELVSDIGNRRFHWNGHLSRTEGVLDTRTRVLFSVVQVSDPYNFYNSVHEEPLRIGTYVNAEIQGQLLEDVMILPRHTLQANDLVWVADQENRLRSRTVDVITSNGDAVYIRGGLQAGDKVVLTRMENPLNSTPVQVQMQPALTNTIN